MFKQLGPLELVLILAVVILVFGVGRLSKLGKDLGEGISAFRKGLKQDETEGETTDSTEASSEQEA
jgi:sec-independent protein translocase protein TatA